MKADTPLPNLINKVHLGFSPEFLTNIPDQCIALTITSPPYFDNDLYLFDDGTAEFGWITYGDYLDHILSLLIELVRITIPGGRVVLVVANTPQLDEHDKVAHFWPIASDTVQLAIEAGFELHGEIIWHKEETNFTELGFGFIPESYPSVTHDTILVFRKQGPLRIDGTEKLAFGSVWKFPSKGPITEYNKLYPSFPTEMVTRLLQLYSLPKDIVLDPYAGSAQVIRIALKYDRYAIGVEADERWEPLWKDLDP